MNVTLLINLLIETIFEVVVRVAQQIQNPILFLLFLIKMAFTSSNTVLLYWSSFENMDGLRYLSDSKQLINVHNQNVMVESREELLERLKHVEKVASFSKWRRAWHHPLKYIAAILHRLLIYPLTRKEWVTSSHTFFDHRMNLLLPSSTDIYLTRGKSHISEIQLARFLIKNLDPGDVFVDAGAHYGYFSLLASLLVGSDGRVVSIEAAPSTFTILSLNVISLPNVRAYQYALSDKSENLIFYEFPNLYSEYNTLNIKQYKDETWLKHYPPREIEITAKRLDDLLQELNIHPKVIKVDVEGAEHQVISGLLNYIEELSPIIIMEYLSEARSNQSHCEAVDLLREKGFQSYIIDLQGELIPVYEINQYFKDFGLDSENIVFKRE
jgi:FkbM family methyltransferase